MVKWLLRMFFLVVSKSFLKGGLCLEGMKRWEAGAVCEVEALRS